MTTTTWNPPYIIRHRPDAEAKIAGPEDALQFMDHSWPFAKGFLFDLARRRCKESAKGKGSAEAARLAFRAAVVEAETFAEHAG